MVHAVAQDTSAEHGQRHFSIRLVLNIVTICFGTTSFGFCNAVIGTSLGQPSFLKAMGLDTAPNATALTAAVLAIYFVGGLFGTACHALTADRYGRKASTSIACAVMIFGATLCTASVNMPMYISFRFFCGWASYQFLSTVPPWVAEITPPSHRGILGNIIAVNIGVGYVLAAYVGVGFFFLSSENDWRGPTALQMLFPLLLLAAMYWLPESPRFLMAKDRHEEALALLKVLHAGANHSSEFAELEFHQIRQQVQSDVDNRMSFFDIFRRPTMRKRALITICLPWCMLGSGVLVINNYGSAIYSKLGYDSFQVLLFLAGWDCVVMIAPFICMTFVDRVSRTYLLATGFFCCMCTLIVLAALQKTYLGTENHAALAACVAMTFLYVLSYVCFLDGPLFFYVAEIWPSHVRVQGFAICTTANCVSNLVWTSAAPSAFASIGWGYYLFFVVQAFLGGVAALLFFPDTARKPLEEIAALFGDQDVVVFQKDLETKGPASGNSEKDSVDYEEMVESAAKV